MSQLFAWNFDEASGQVIDYSGNNRNLTLSGTTTRTTAGSGHGGGSSKGLFMTSTSESFTGGISIPTQPVLRSIACWVKDTSAPIDGRALEWYDSGGDVSIFRFGFRSQWHFQVTNASTFGRVTINRPTDNLYHHLAGTYDGSTIRLYLDAVLQPTTSFAGPILTNANTFNVLKTTGSGITIDDAVGYDHVLSQSEVTTLFNNPIGPTGANLYFSNGAQATGVYEMTAGGVLVQRNNLITIK